MSNVDDAALGRAVNELTISYSLRDILARIEENQHRADQNIVNLKEQLATKAEVAELAAIVSRQEARWQRIIGAAMALGALTGGAMGWVVNLLQGGPS